MKKHLKYVGIDFKDHWTPHNPDGESPETSVCFALIEFNSRSDQEHILDEYQHYLPGLYKIVLDVAADYELVKNLWDNGLIKGNPFDLPEDEPVTDNAIIKQLVTKRLETKKGRMDKEKHIFMTGTELANDEYKCENIVGMIRCAIPNVSKNKDDMEYVVVHPERYRNESMERVKAITDISLKMAKNIFTIYKAFAKYSRIEADKYATYIRNLRMKGMSVNLLKQHNRAYIEKHFDKNILIPRMFQIIFRNKSKFLIAMEKKIEISQKTLHDPNALEPFMRRYVDIATNISARIKNMKPEVVARELTAEERMNPNHTPAVLEHMIKATIYDTVMNGFYDLDGQPFEVVLSTKRHLEDIVGFQLIYEFDLENGTDVRKISWFNDITSENVLNINKEVRNKFDEVAERN